MKKVRNIMSSLREQFTADLKTAMKAGEKGKIAAIRLIQAALKDKDIEARGAGKGEATADEILALLQKMIKQREESAKIFAENGRPELAAQEREEITVIQSFMPEQLSDEKVRELISGVIAEIGAQGLRDMGKVMAVLKERYPGQMDFAKASGVVKDLLK